MRQVTLQLDLGGNAPPLGLKPNVKEQLVEMMAQVIVAVHQAAAETELAQSIGEVQSEAGVDDER